MADALVPDWLSAPADANDLVPALWPASAERVDGELRIGGVPAGELSARFGTPLFVVDEADARARAARVRAVLETAFERIGTRAHVYYAGKAFLSIDVARWMAEAGLGIDVCSGGELAVALAAGVDPAIIGFHGNNKSVAEIERAVGAGVGAIVLDSLTEIDRVARAAAALGRRQSVRLRVNSGVHAHTHDFLATAHEDQKFGLPLGAVPEAVARIRAADSLGFLGLHCHIGSQIFDAGGFAESASRLLEVHAALLAGGEVPELNLGGGFGVAYTRADRPVALEETAQRIAEAVAAECARLAIPVPVVAFEPGRAIIAPTTVTLYTVGTVKPVDVQTGESTAVRTYVSVDGGMSDNIRPALYGADYSVRIASRASEAPPAVVRIAGKHCESGDIVVDVDYLPSDVAPGDLLAVPVTGAYCWSLASNYNYLTRPAVVAVSAGSARVMIRRESEADLLARDAGTRERGNA